MATFVTPLALTIRTMNAIGGIRFQAVQAARLRDITLERAVATVDQDEARNGAAQSDGVRLASREQDKDGNQVPFHVYLQRVAKFKAGLKDKKQEAAKKPECPIEKARAESTTGENVPLNWLIADHFGGDGDAVLPADDAVHTETESTFSAADATFTLQPSVPDAPSSLLDSEWLISPNS